ncbi:hypothetical protein BH11MYX1_BH11MYX1_21270 [soil metagenome]
MTSWILALMLALAGTAGAYPLVLPKQPATVREAHAAAFRARNPQHFREVEVNERGYVAHVVTDDPTLVPAGSTGHAVAWAWSDADVAKIRDFLRANSDLFGIDPAALDRLHGGEPSLLVVDAIGGATLGEVNFQRVAQANQPQLVDITVMFWIAATPQHSEQAIAKRVIGHTYRVTVGYGMPPMRDCAMTPRGAAGCQIRVQHTANREVKLGAADVRTVTWLAPDGDKIRLVTCVDAADLPPAPAAPSWQGLALSARTFAPRGTAPPLPLVVDAVTGERVTMRIRDCYDPVFSSIRDEQ